MWRSRTDDSGYRTVAGQALTRLADRELKRGQAAKAAGDSPAAGRRRRASDDLRRQAERQS
jgi:hypothetical protein